MEHYSTLEDIADFLEDNDDYCIYYHKNPDGDAIGSAYALAMALKAMKKNVNILCDSPVPAPYHYLTDRYGTDREIRSRTINISVDSAAPARLGRYSDAKITVCIDHHNVNTIEAKYKYVAPKACSCAEIIYELIRIIGVPISALMADFLYVGVCTDSMCFRSEAVNSDTLRTAYELSMCHADVVSIARRFYVTRTEKRIKIENRLTGSFKLHAGGKILSSVLTNDDYNELDITPDDTEGINDLVETVEGVKIGIVVRERTKGRCRISVRSMCRVGADRICAALGGGGHSNAAGAELDGSAEEVLRTVVETAERFLNESETL